MSWIEDEVTKRKNKATMAEIERLKEEAARSAKMRAEKAEKEGMSRLSKLLLAENAKLPELLRLTYKEATDSGFSLFDKRGFKISCNNIAICLSARSESWGYIHYDAKKGKYTYGYNTTKPDKPDKHNEVATDKPDNFARAIIKAIVTNDRWVLHGFCERCTGRFF